MKPSRLDSDSASHGAEGERDPEDGRSEADDRFGPVNWALFVSGFVSMCLGYLFLALASQRVEDAIFRFSTWSPILIVAGLLVFGLGLIPRRKKS